MDEKDLFADMFGDTNATREASEKKDGETVISVDTNKMKELDVKPSDMTGLAVSDEKKDDDAHENGNPSDEGVDQKLIEDAKNELGIGGAAFCDEIVATCPDVITRLKKQKKTLHGFFNFAYSYALDEYVKKNGQTDGGGFWNLAELAEKYLDPDVKEGYVVKEPKAKPYVPPTIAKSPNKDDAKKTIEKIAKKAAKAAKKEAKKKEPKEEPKEEPKLNVPTKIKDSFAGFDFGSIFG